MITQKRRRGGWFNAGLLAGMLSLLVLSGSPLAALLPRVVSGETMYYDTVLGITWLGDALYARTSGYDADGLMTWADTAAWADQLLIGPFGDWRLPTMRPLNDKSFVNEFSYDGSTDYGYGISAPGTLYAGSAASELAYMYYVNLANRAIYTADSTPENMIPDPLGGLVNTGPFLNLGAAGLAEIVYWSPLTYAADGSSARVFVMNGRQGAYDIQREFLGWAVRNGDVVPEPPIAPIFVLGATLAVVMTRRWR